MGIIQRQGIRGALTSYLGVVIGTFNVLWLYPKLLQPGEIGLLRGLADFAAIVVPFVVLGASPVCIRYFPMFKDEARRHNGFLSLLLLVPLIGFALFTLIFFLTSGWLQDFFAAKSALFSQYLYLVLPLCFCLMYYTVLESYSRSLHKIVVPAFINEVLVRLGILATVTLYAVLNMQQNSLLYGYVGVYALALLLIITYIHYLKAWQTPTYIDAKVLTKIPEMGNYAFFVLLGSVGAMIVGKIDSLMVIKMVGLADGGVYSIALFIGTVIEIPRRAISQISAPVIAHQIARQEMDALANLYRRISINQTVVGLLLLLGIWANVDNLFALMPNGQVYAAGKYVVLFIGLAKLIDMSTSINNEIITLSKYYRYHLFMMLLLVTLTIGANLLLIPRWGITGAALASVIALFVFNLVKYLFIWAVMKMQPFTLHTAGAFLVAGITWGVNLLLPRLPHVALDLAVRSAVVGGVFVTLVILLHISPDANNMFTKMLNRLTGKR